MTYTLMVEIESEKTFNQIQQLIERYIGETSPPTQQVTTLAIFHINERLEDLECVKLFLNKHNVPTEQDGKRLSYVGRIQAFAKTGQKISSHVFEQLASLEHDRWAHWQAYLFSKTIEAPGGKLIPKELVDRWTRQVETKYKDLSEKEKESDRQEVCKYLEMLGIKVQETECT